MILEFVKVREDIVVPCRANPSDAGLDVFFNPADGKPVSIEPSNGKSLLPTGIRLGIPHGYMVQVMNRSSVASKQQLIVGAHCVDSGYDGEIFIDIHNVGSTIRTILPGDKIAQLVMVPVVHFRLREADTLYDDPITISDRGDGALRQYHP